MAYLAEVAQSLGITDARHLRRCLADAGIVLDTLPKSAEDRRRRVISDADTERLRASYQKLYGVQRADADVLRRLEAVERALAEMRAVLTDVQRRFRETSHDDDNHAPS